MRIGQQSWKSRSIGTKYPITRKKSPLLFNKKKKSPRRRKKSPQIFGIEIDSRKIVKKLLLLGMALFALIFLFIMILFWWYSRNLPPVTAFEDSGIIIAQSTKIYDRTGKHLLYTFHGEENRTSIPIEDIPDIVKWATIAVEDKNFYSRSIPVDIKGLIRAFLGILKNQGLGGPGGSTLTQQLVKNLILTREKSLERKIKEILLAHQMEKHYSKNKILEMYLNQIPYGSNAYGIQSAANTFFAKNAEDLTLAEAALLAALPKAPTRYSPYGNKTEELFKRQKTILWLMLNQGYISEEEYNRALDEKLEFKSKIINIKAPHFVFYVREQLADLFGDSEIEQGGLKITTTLDYDLQQIAEEEVLKGAEANSAYKAYNAALVALDPKTGQILAMAGSRDYFDKEHDGNVNVILRRRQPGSSFKPIIYAAAFAKGYTPNTILYDVETNFSPGQSLKPYIPKNFNEKIYGPKMMKNTLAGSLNIPAVKTLYLAGISNVINTAKVLGYSTFDKAQDCGLALALGCVEVLPLEHAAAIGAFATGGVYHKPQSLLRVEDENGVVLEEYKDESRQAIDAQTANLITHVLSTDEYRQFVFGKGSMLTLKDRLSAAKTGTTNDVLDAWTVGFTPSLVSVVWAGNNENDQVIKSDATGLRLAAPIWNGFMTRALSGKSAEPFPAVTIEKTGINVLDGISHFETVQIDEVSGKRATVHTPFEHIKEVTFEQHRSILHYINKDNPKATPVGYGPDSDAQYEKWELGVQEWASKNQEEGAEIVNTAPPSEYDDVHLPENKPEIEVLFPAPNSLITTNSVKVMTRITAKRKISKIEYYINGNLREVAGTKPYDREIFFGNTADGNQILTVMAHDDVGNYSKKDLVFKLERGITTSVTPLDPDSAKIHPKLSWMNIKQKNEFTKDSFPFEIELLVANFDITERINIYYEQNNVPQFIGGVKNPETENIYIPWTNTPSPGAYTLYAIIISKQGDSYKSDQLEINITDPPANESETGLLPNRIYNEN